MSMHRIEQSRHAMNRIGAPPQSSRRLQAWLPLLASLITAGIALPQRAAAQSCHSPSLRPTDGLAYRASLTGTLGSFSTAATRGEYQGWFATFTFTHPWFLAEVSLPTYRIAQTGSHAYGLGDLALTLRGQFFRSKPSVNGANGASDGAIIAGPELTSTLPTGDMDKGLGMGHVMLMPGAFVSWQRAGFAVIAQVAYGRALQFGSHAHMHMDPAPIVNPMNRSELSHAIGASAALHEHLRVTARLIGAVPWFDHGGAAREIVAPGLQVIAGMFDAALELQLPVVGKPFDSRTIATIGAQW
jgi:hypothetical protein